MQNKNKASATKGGNKKAVTITVAQELHVDVDLRRLNEACAPLGDVMVPFTKRARAEITRVKEGEQEGVPQIPLFIHETISYAHMRHLFTIAVPPYPFLRVIQLHHCHIGDDGVLILCEFLRDYKPTPDKNPFGVECVEVPGCSLGPRGAGYLGKMLSENTTVKKLVVDFNDLGDAGASAICEGLRWNSHMESLSLDYCKIGSEGASHVASKVIRGSNVKALSLKGNILGESGVSDIAKALGVGTSIEELSLCDVGFGTQAETVEVLCEGIETSVSLSSLNLDLNNIVPAGVQALANSIQRNTRIVDLVLAERTDEKVYSDIIDTLMKNRKAAKKSKKGKGKK